MSSVNKYFKSNTLLLIIIAIIYFLSPLLSLLLAIFYIWKRSKLSNKLKFLTSIGLALLLFLPLASAFGIFPIRPLKVSGDAMEPQLKKNAYILARSYFPRLDSIKRGEIVIHKFTTNKDYSTVRRVIGLSGETILIEEGKVYINKKLLDEREYLSTVRTSGGKFIQENIPLKIPNDSYVVMSDNRGESDDSREWGFINKSDLENIYLFCYYNC